jgi:hypothetical protein
MERVGTLINKLKEQFDQQADSNRLLMTAQMLLSELQQKQVTNASGKVSVVMPAYIKQEPLLEEEPAPTTVATVITKEEEKEQPPIVNIEPEIRNSEPVTETKQEGHAGWLFDPVSTIPTLAHQEVKEVYELNTSIAVEDEPESHNDKLKEEKIEVATVLQGTPVKDLKKAIGINDRYLFINELFRGDESMYERSIKTINAFNIYPEAEYWIQREMKTKLGWIDDTEAVKLFDQLVKRRFS